MRLILAQPVQGNSKKKSARGLKKSRRVALLVQARIGATHGTLLCGAQRIPCSFGAAGIGYKKREGDGITPIGTFPLRVALLTTSRYSNRLYTPISRLPLLRTNARVAWCDDARHPRKYNRPIALPSRLSHETLHRRDNLYDLLIVLGFNDAPARARRGSAIFLHATRVTKGTTNSTTKEPFATTEGCIAVKPKALRATLAKLDRHCVIRITQARGCEK